MKHVRAFCLAYILLSLTLFIGVTEALKQGWLPNSAWLDYCLLPGSWILDPFAHNWFLTATQAWDAAQRSGAAFVLCLASNLGFLAGLGLFVSRIRSYRSRSLSSSWE